MTLSTTAGAFIRRLALASLLIAGLTGASDPPVAIKKWQALVEAAGSAYEADRPVQAQQLLEEAVKMTEPGTEGRAAVLNNLAIVLEANGFMDAAEQLYGQVIGLWAELLGPNHTNVSRTLGNLGDLHHRRGQLERANEAYTVAIATAEQANGGDAAQVLRALYDNYSRLLNDMGRTEDANAARVKAFPSGN
jgi:tetratricopeptide (TPR) repeat protein